MRIEPPLQGSGVRKASESSLMRIELTVCPICGASESSFRRTVRDPWSWEDFRVHRRAERLHVSNILVVHRHYPPSQLLEPAPDVTPFRQISQESA